MGKKTVSFYTLGCKANQYDTEVMAEAFENAGYEVVDFGEVADVYVVNTCTVTGLSARKSRQAIRRAKQLNANAITAAVGCYPQTAKNEVEKIEEVDIIAGTSDRMKLPEYVEAFKKQNKKISVVDNIMKRRDFEKIKIERYKDRTRAFLKIQEGCSQYCSYCIIPYARGPIRSRPPEDVLEEVEKLAKGGFKEIVLTGIHIASYGRETGKANLLELLKQINEVGGIDRIRIGSVEPGLITEEFALAVSKLEKLCPHYHVSIQSGCDETLKRMNRKYTTAQYKNAVELLRAHIPDVMITTDVMVGFPGETDEEFEKTYEFVKDIAFYKMHVFKYSPRKGTPAATFEGQVDSAVKDARSERLIRLSGECMLSYHKKYVGRELPVLFEQEVKDMEGYYEGLAPNYIRVVAKGNNTLEGNIKTVRITVAEPDRMIGEI